MAIFGDDDEALDLGLGDQHPIERVAVVWRKSTRLFRVTKHVPLLVFIREDLRVPERIDHFLGGLIKVRSNPDLPFQYT